MSPQRTRGIGFGTALPCHPNTACKQDSIIELIANSAANAYGHGGRYWVVYRRIYQ